MARRSIEERLAQLDAQRKTLQARLGKQDRANDTRRKVLLGALLLRRLESSTDPDLVKRLVRATLKGMKAIIDDPKAAAVDYVKAVPENAGKEAEIAEIFKGYADFVYPGQKVLGEMDEARLADLQEFYLKQGIIQQKTPVKDLYTNQFVQ